MFTIDLKKAQPTENPDGSLTRFGNRILEAYANRWLAGTRDLDTERKFPELAGPFYDVRSDLEYARAQATQG